MKTHQRYGRAIGAFMIIALSRCGRANWGTPAGASFTWCCANDSNRALSFVAGDGGRRPAVLSGGPCQSGTCIYSYPAAELVGRVTERSNLGLCSDSRGDVMPNLRFQ